MKMKILSGVVCAIFFIFSVIGKCEGRSVAGEPYSLTFSGPGSTKVEIHNATFEKLTGVHLKNLNQDLTYLKISDSNIGEIDTFAFDNLKHLNLLDLSNNKIKNEIHPNTFSRLPGLEILILKNLGSQNITLNLMNVQVLILSENEVEEFGDSRIDGENIYSLDLSGNRLRVLSDGFGNLSKLSWLNLSKNKINYIGSGVFENNTNLMTVVASENKLTSTQGLTIPSLKTLNLFGNRIEALGSEAFAQMKSLEELVLSFNIIKMLQDPFKDLIELKFLDLDWNDIENLEPGLFRNNLYLTKLSVQGNKLASLYRFPKVLYHLIHLDLSHNKLSVIEKDFFKSTPNLNFLDLSFNKLKTVSRILEPLASLNILNLAFNGLALSGEEFFGNPELTYLNLSTNELELNLGVFRNNVQLKTLDLSSNKISKFCDRDLKFKNLLKISLQGNQIQSLSCLNSKDFESLCEVDIRNNPLVCGQELDEFIWNLATRRSSPLRSGQRSTSDLSFTQCDILSLNESFELWNDVKRGMCPDGVNLIVPVRIEEKVSGNEENSEFSDVEKWVDIPEVPRNLDLKEFLQRTENPQSERKSWEEIEEIPEVLESLEEEEKEELEEEEMEEKIKFFTYRWYSNPVLVAVLLILLFCKIVIFVFLFIRIKYWKKSAIGTTEKYTFLQNEVYKRTTEPSPVTDEEQLLDNRTRNLTTAYLNSFFDNFGFSQKEKHPESDKNKLIGS